MRNVLKVLGFIFSWLAPFVVIYVNHIVLVDKTFDVDMFGLLLALALLIGLIKWIDNKCKVWEIQDRNKMFRHNWLSGKKIILASVLTWVLYTIEDDLGKMQWSGVLVTICFIIGWFLTMLSNIKRYKKKAD